MPGATPEPPVVEFAIPAYGDGALLRQAVDGVLRQDAPNWRLTVVDDRAGTEPAGTPGEAAVDTLGAELAALADPRVSYLRNPVNLGINRNFQRCLEVATAELVVLLGADDRPLPDYVRTVTEVARAHPDVDLIHPGVRVIDARGEPHRPVGDRIKAAMRTRVPRGRQVRVTGGERLAASLLRGNWMYFPSIAFRREAAVRHGFRPGYDVVLDLDLYLRMLLDGSRVAMVRRVCFEYRRHAASLSSTEALSGDRFDEELRYFAEVRADLRAAGWNAAARAAGWHVTSRLHALLVAPAALRAGDRARLRRIAAHAFGRTPAVPGQRVAASLPERSTR